MGFYGIRRRKPQIERTAAGGFVAAQAGDPRSEALPRADGKHRKHEEQNRWMKTTVVIPNYNGKHFLQDCLDSLLQSTGIVDAPVGFVYTDGLVMLGMITNMLPFAVLPMYSSIEKLSKSLLEASADLGASRRETFFNITLPLTFPGIFSSIILVFIPSLGIYTVTDMLGGGKVLYIGNIIKNQFGAIRNWPLGAALSVLLIVITGLLIFIYTRFAKIEDMEVV